MSDRMVPVPESALRALALPVGHPDREKHYTAIATLVACLPEPTFTDEEALAFYRASFDAGLSDNHAIRIGRRFLTTLAKAGWTAPKALCPPPSPALVELVEAARETAKFYAVSSNRLRAAVAAYDEQEG